MNFINAAFKEATIATNNYISQNGADFPCGFAWCLIDVRSNSKIGKDLLTHPRIEKNTLGRGLRVYNPSGSYTQSMYAKEAGAKKFADIMTSFGIPTQAITRID